MAEELSKPHIIRPYGPVAFSVDDDGRSVAEVKDRFLLRIDPASVSKAGAAYVDAATKLEKFNEVVRSAAVEMAKVWEGPASVTAQQALRTLHATIRELAQKARAFGTPLIPLGERLLDHQEFVQSNSSAWSNNSYTYNDSIPGWYKTMDKGWEYGSQDELAGQHLRLLNNDLAKAYEQFPTYVYKALPDIKDPQYTPPKIELDDDPHEYHVDPAVLRPPGGELKGPGIDVGGVTPTIDGGPAGPPDGGIDAPGAFDPDGAFPDRGSEDGGVDGGVGADGRYPDGTYPVGAPLNNDGTNGSKSVSAGPNVTNPNLVVENPRIPDMAGQDPSDSRTNLQDYQRPVTWDPNAITSLPNGSLPNSHTGVGTGPGTGMGGNLMAGPAGLGRNARSASAAGMPFLPMAGAGAGAGANEPKDKENSTWLHEDDDVWGADTDGTVSDKIG
ncbi:WXG100 family type VII secretion target [Nonomuraea sp. GTA35]|uniref:WXG100 family type VII secretion target n=1 Tax=Nonomuraea sp. GTA35 TaxID=1676746 RepID=UPI0035C1C674